jgi:hypothetical protein
MCAHNGKKGRCSKACEGFVSKVGQKAASDVGALAKQVAPAKPAKVATDLPATPAPENVLGICRMPLYPGFCDFEALFGRIQAKPWI